MTIALISDIHANFFYFQVILKELEQYNPSQIFCLGDMVGYYDQPNEVIDLIKEKNITCIKGNHEKYLLNELAYDHSKENIYRIKTQRESLTQDNYTFLKNLPNDIIIELYGKQFYMTHSLPNDCITYLHDLKKIDRKALAKYDYYCFGHTHVPIISYQYGTYILNPGSVGQPRDYSQKPSFIILDLEKDEVTLKKISVPYLAYSQLLETNNFDNALISILERDRNAKN